SDPGPVFHTIVSTSKNDGHYFCGTGGNRPDGLNEPVTMKPTLSRELALDALLMAIWRCKPSENVIVHSVQGSQYGSDDWQRFCRANNLAPGMSRRGNCWDNAVAESFLSSLQKERIRKRIYKTRDMARADIFDYIEVFYNRNRCHSHLGGVSPEAFEKASP
uniref:IS3 family transposase n=1 Tax=Escherichia coli TaxID=562 RepID=UPI0021BF925E